ncbi:hypothetical protein, partial [Pseudomonas aeruginosa]|uniref:cytidine deaminase-like fold-containing protein n=1 Tax=Pseudomonas aeruginosa TaxID=287 RepID=UPI001CD65114
WLALCLSFQALRLFYEFRQQAYNAGKTTGADMALKVEGKAVCSYCRGDIAAAAEKAGLNSLQINEVTTGKTLYWKPGMRSLRELE